MTLPANLQAQVDAATKAVTDAQNTLNSYNQGIAAEYQNMNNVFVNLDTGCYHNRPQSLDNQLAIGTLNINNCCNHFTHTNSTVDSCHKAVSDFAYYYNNYRTVQTQAASAQVALSTAQRNLQNVLASVAQQVGSDPATILANHQIEANATQKRNTQIFYAVVIIAILIALYFIFKKSAA